MNEDGLFDILPGTTARVLYVPSQSSPGKSYMVVAPLEDGSPWYCSCPSRKYRPEQDCKHIVAAREEIKRGDV